MIRLSNCKLHFNVIIITDEALHEVVTYNIASTGSRNAMILTNEYYQVSSIFSSLSKWVLDHQIESLE